MKVFFLVTVAGFTGLRMSPWFWGHALPYQRADLIGAVVVLAALVSLGWKGLRRLGRPRPRQRSPRRRDAGYPAQAPWSR